MAQLFSVLTKSLKRDQYIIFLQNNNLVKQAKLAQVFPFKVNVPWAKEGKSISEFKGKRDYRGEYDAIFESNMKKVKTIQSQRPSVHVEIEKQKPQEIQDMNNILGELDITSDPNIKGIQSNKGGDSNKNIHSQQNHKRSERHFGSSHLGSSSNDKEFQSVKSELMSNPTPFSSHLQENDRAKKSNKYEENFTSFKSNYQKGDDPNNSFPSYMLENQFQGLRAGNLTMMKMIDPETIRKNMNFYFECTSLISQHLDDPNFTLYSIKQLFITSFYARYSEQIKAHREQLKLKEKQTEDMIRNQSENQNSNLSETNSYNQYKQRRSLGSPQMIHVYQDQQINQNNEYIFNNVSTQKFTSQEDFSPLQDAFRIYKNALREFQYFVKVYMEIIKQYYDIHYKKNSQMNEGLKELFSYHNFQNFIISKLFQNEKIPKILIELIKLVIPDDTDLINSIDRTQLTPQMFGIPKYLSLDFETKKLLQNSISQDVFGSIKEEFEDQDEKSLHHNNKIQFNQNNNTSQGSRQIGEIENKVQNKLNSDQLSSPSNKPQEVQNQPQETQEAGANNDEDKIGDIDEDQDMLFELKITTQLKSQFTQYFQQNDPLRGNSNIFQTQTVKQNKQNDVDGEQTPTQKTNPYQKCIDYIENIQNSITPTGKFKAMIQACESIEKCIQEFYKQNGKTFNGSLDEENIISILTYVIAQTGYCNLEPHCKFVHSFYKNPTKKMKLKYYLIAIEISIRNMQELYYYLSQQQKQMQSINNSQPNTNVDNDISINNNKSPISIYKKNLNKILNENFGENSNFNPKILKNITGRNSFLKQTLAEVKQ